MEQGPSFNYERHSQPSLERRAGVLSTEREILEYLQTPENAEELQTYWEYLAELNGFILEQVPSSERTQALREVHTDLNRPGDVVGSLPTTLPTSRVLPIGNHMDFTVGYRASAQWPDSSRGSLELGDNQIITPDTPIGIIDYYRNIARLNSDGSLVRFTRGLVADMTTSLGILAREVQLLDVSATIVKAVSGMSHLARLGHRFGFTVFDITDSGRQGRVTSASFRIASGIVSNNPKWQRLREKYKPAQIGIISRDDLIHKFDS